MLDKGVAHCDCSSKLFPEVRLILGHDGYTQPKPAQCNTSMVKSKLCVLLFIENIAILFNYTQTKQKLQTASQTMCQAESPRVTVTR